MCGINRAKLILDVQAQMVKEFTRKGCGAIGAAAKVVWSQEQRVAEVEAQLQELEARIAAAQSSSTSDQRISAKSAEQ